MANTKKTGTFKGKSNKLGQGGRAAQLKAQGVPGGVIGNIARSENAAPGQKNFHRKSKRATAKKAVPGYPDQTTTPKIESGNALRGKKRSMPQRRSHRTMSGMQMLTKATKSK